MDGYYIKKEGIKMGDFKVGDKVMVIKKIDDYLSCEVGTIATVINVLSPSEHYGEPGFTILIDWETNSDWVNKSEIEKVTHTNVKQPKIKGVWTSATTSRVGLLILSAMLLVSLILGGLHSISSAIFAVLTFIALVNDEMCRYEFKERKRYRKDVK